MKFIYKKTTDNNYGVETFQLEVEACTEDELQVLFSTIIHRIPSARKIIE